MVRNVEKPRAVLPRDAQLRLADYDDKPSLETAFEGVDTLLFVASDGAGPDVTRHHANVIDAAVSCGVRQIVFTSIIDIDAGSPFYFTPIYRDAERRLIASGLGWTILRCGLYAEFIFSNWLEAARSSGEISLPVGAGRVALVSKGDVAAAAAAVASSGKHQGKTYDVTGLTSYSFEEIASATSQAFGTPIKYVDCAPSDFLQRAWTRMKEPWLHAYVSLFASIAQGRYEATSADVETLTGRSSESLEAFLHQRAEPPTPR